MNRKNQIFEAVSRHIFKEFYQLNEQPQKNCQNLYEFSIPTMLPSQMQSMIQNKDKIITGAREQGADPQDEQGIPIYSPTDVNRFNDPRWLRNAQKEKMKDMLDRGIAAIPNFPASMLKVGENMGQMSMRQGEASRVLAGLPPPMMRSGRGGNSGLPNAALYGVPGAEVVYNPNRISSPTALMALRNNAAKAAARLKAQEAGAASAPPPASNTGTGSAPVPTPSGTTPPSSTPPSQSGAPTPQSGAPTPQSGAPKAPPQSGAPR